MRKPNFHCKTIVLLFVMLSLTGCVWLRLLEFRNQLGEFDDYFVTKVNGEGFTLGFREPVLFSDDLIYLSRLEPSKKSKLHDTVDWLYDFKKIDAEGKLVSPEVDIIFRLGFNGENMMSSWTFSPIFLAMAPPQFLEMSLRGLGSSKIFRSKRQVKATFDSLPKLKAELPLKQDIIRNLGDPVEIVEESRDQQQYIYHFMLETDYVEKGYEDRRFMEMKLDFANDSGKLLKMWSKFVGMKVSIDYRKLVDGTESEVSDTKGLPSGKEIQNT